MYHIKNVYTDKKITKAIILGNVSLLANTSDTGMFVMLEMIFGKIGLASQIHK